METSHYPGEAAEGLRLAECHDPAVLPVRICLRQAESDLTFQILSKIQEGHRHEE